MAVVVGRRLCACLLNISEARNKDVIERVASSALLVNQDSEEYGASQRTSETRIKASVLNIFQDHDYNRSVITIVSSIDQIGHSVVDACCTAFDLIDLGHHKGGHPRLGAVDLVPIHPLSKDVTLDECGIVARDIADRVTSAVPGTSAFLFGAADLPLKRGLVERRKAVGWYQGKHASSYEAVKHDVGAIPGTRYGVTGIGAIPYVMNCNVTIATQDVSLGRQIAASLRATSPGGLPGVQAMAFPHDGQVEIACNVEAVPTADVSPGDLNNDLDNVAYSAFGNFQHMSPVETEEHNVAKDYSVFGHFWHVSPVEIERRVAAKATAAGVGTMGTALVGFTPEEAERLALYALSEGRDDLWRQRKERRM